MASLSDRLRDSTQTGERRCWPCTAVNAGILLLACVGVARRRSRPLAAALGVAGGIVIALRGYLLPYTPRFAPQLVSRLPGDLFHAEGHRETSLARDAPVASDSLGGDGDGETGHAVLEALLDCGVVAADEETVYLDDDFRRAWRAEMRNLRNRNDEGLANALRAVEPEWAVVNVVESGNAQSGESGESWFVVSDGSDDPARERWLTRPVVVAETAAVWVLSDRTDLSETRRVQATGPLRTFLEACPTCDGAVEKTTAIECCGGPGGTRADAPDEVLACTDCGARLYTFR